MRQFKIKKQLYLCVFILMYIDHFAYQITYKGQFIETKSSLVNATNDHKCKKKSIYALFGLSYDSVCTGMAPVHTIVSCAQTQNGYHPSYRLKPNDITYSKRPEVARALRKCSLFRSVESR